MLCLLILLVLYGGCQTLDPYRLSEEQFLRHLRSYADIFNSTQADLLFQLDGNTGNSFSGVSASCTDKLKALAKPLFPYIVKGDIKGLFAWFMKSDLFAYIDSWGRPQGRLHVGNSLWKGAYEECLAIPGSHYCLAEMVLLNQTTLLDGELGTCFPKQCSNEDVHKILKITRPYVHTIIDFPSNGSFVRVHKQTPVVCSDARQSWPPDAIVCVCLLSFLCIMVLLGTVLDVVKDAFTPDHLLEDITSQPINPNEHISYVRFGLNESTSKRGKFFTEALLCFSLLDTLPRTLATRKPTNGVHSINGMRVISISWVVLGHCYFFLQDLNIDNAKILLDKLHLFTFQALLNAFFSVDTFFVLSGLLVSYLALRRMDSSDGKLNLVQFYVHRIVRLTPTYMLVIFIHTSLLPALISGPSTFKLEVKLQNCRDYWWTNLCYINNFFPKSFAEDSCLIWSWYLANDMQFYVISPIILYVMYRYKQWGAALSTSIGVLLCVVITITLTLYFHIPQLVTELFLQHISPQSALVFSNDVYSKPYTRIAPYLIGLLLGYVLSRDIRIGKRNFATGLIIWSVAIALGLVVVYGPYSAFKPDGHKFNDLENVFYGGFSRVAWSVAVCLVIYACHNKMGGSINDFLSWGFWIPFSRLTFGTYLIHPVVIRFFYFSLDNANHYQSVTMAFLFVAVWVVSYGLSFLLALILDVPIMNLERKVFAQLSS